ncbi:eCIS core domain-containing protein [Flavivirga aquatica]|uniref:eCIS core domain-containing protein n=1 Tax=Flavivirga aquatica TaxID=1849968 RepID=UPI0009F5365A|nr:DUF4157 domain-containing protein [Flavivirga aquatica]
MSIYLDELENKSTLSNTEKKETQSIQFEDKRAKNSKQNHIQSTINNSSRVVSQKEKMDSISSAPIQKKENKTGLPDQLKSGIENLSGIDMSDTRVHYNSPKPTQLQAHAYAQGTDIHVASGQEKHLGHEAWHVVQQKQGRVKPTTQLKGVDVNDNIGLEREADIMGEKAIQKPGTKNLQLKPIASTSSSAQLKTIQRAQNDAENEKNARTNCALVTIANLTGKDKSSDVSGDLEQDNQFFVNYMRSYDDRLKNIESNEENDMDLQTMGMIAWVFKDKGAYPKGWTAEKFEASITALATEKEPNVNEPRTVSDAEDEMKLYDSGTKFAVQCTGAGGILSHWLIAENKDGTIKYIDDQANRPARAANVDDVSSDLQEDSVKGSVRGSVDFGSDFGSLDGGSRRGSLESLSDRSDIEDSQGGDLANLPEAKQTRGNLWVKSGKVGDIKEFLSPNKEKEVARIKYEDMTASKPYDTPVWFRDDTAAGELVAVKADAIISIIPQV